MTTNGLTRLGTAATLLISSSLLAQDLAGPVRGPLHDVVAYGIDARTSELVRYGFDVDRCERLGIVRDRKSEVVSDVQGLAMIPDGPHRGLYGVANFYMTRPSRLVVIDGADAASRLASSVVGYGKIEGLVADHDPDTGRWSLLAVAREPETMLLRIDPATGVGHSVMRTVNRYHGLARAADGTLYGTTHDFAALWRIDVEEGVETPVASLDEYRRVGALEFAFDANMTSHGMLLGLADNENALLIIDPATGVTRERASRLGRVTFEGLAFTTRTADPFRPVLTATE